MEPGVATPPMSGPISTESALVTAPQLKVVDCPVIIDAGDALKEAILGVPLQPFGGGGTVGVAVRVGGMVGGTTVIVSERWAV